MTELNLVKTRIGALCQAEVQTGMDMPLPEQTHSQAFENQKYTQWKYTQCLLNQDMETDKRSVIQVLLDRNRCCSFGESLYWKAF